MPQQSELMDKAEDVADQVILPVCLSIGVAKVAINCLIYQACLKPAQKTEIIRGTCQCQHASQLMPVFCLFFCYIQMFSYRFFKVHCIVDIVCMI